MDNAAAKPCPSDAVEKIQELTLLYESCLASVEKSEATVKKLEQLLSARDETIVEQSDKLSALVEKIRALMIKYTELKAQAQILNENNTQNKRILAEKVKVPQFLYYADQYFMFSFF